MLMIISLTSDSLFLVDQFTMASNISISGAQNELREMTSITDCCNITTCVTAPSRGGGAHSHSGSRSKAKFSDSDWSHVQGSYRARNRSFHFMTMTVIICCAAIGMT